MGYASAGRAQMHRGLEAGLLMTPLGRVASDANYPLDGRTVTILYRAQSNE